MNILLLIFLILCITSIAMALIGLFIAKRERIPDNLTSILSTMNNLEKAKYMVNLLDNGYVQRHILTNDAPEHDDETTKGSYIAFLDVAAITIIKGIRGNYSYE